MDTEGVTLLPYSPIGSASVDALGALCHGFYASIFSGNHTRVSEYMSPDFAVIQSPTMPYNQSIFDGILGALMVGDQQHQFLNPNNLTIRIFTLGESHCIANGVDEHATLIDNTLGTFRFEFLEHSYWADSLIQSAKPYFFNTYPIMRGQMRKRGAYRYVRWKDHDDQQKDDAIAEFNKAFPLNYDPRTL
ncbi:hypothetical protein D9758_015736 [Tetrapyrgos nigripes]|uniref:Uncharacterized protein n=1 Tax=Tetrapyrgos nigripes TaxID=182062 RepID=A0A8H5CRR1_9AGAR|nr:hypothetical protein D9758_015736 [Tetrapyrgos nigripes]